jgi:hypothetical protein
MFKTYDDGGEVDVNDGEHQLAVLQNGERVLTPEQAEQYEKDHPKEAAKSDQTPLVVAPAPTTSSALGTVQPSVGAAPRAYQNQAGEQVTPQDLVSPAAAKVTSPIGSARIMPAEQPKDAEVQAPDMSSFGSALDQHMKLVNDQKKSEAAAKGDLVGLGAAIIESRHAPTLQPSGTADLEAHKKFAGPVPGSTEDLESRGETPLVPQPLSGKQAYEQKMAQFKQQYQDAMDEFTPEGRERAASIKEAMLAYEKEHPYGSPESAKPGFLGKVEHALADVGNAAGSVFGPAAAAERSIPQSAIGRARQEKQAEQMGSDAAKESLENAQAGQANSVAAQGKGADFSIEKGDDGNLWRINKRTNTAEPVQFNTPGAPQSTQLVPTSAPTGPLGTAMPAGGFSTATTPTFGRDPKKQATGVEGAAQQRDELSTLTENMKPEEAQAFLSAYSVKPTDTVAEANEKMQLAHQSAQLGATQRLAKINEDAKNLQHSDHEEDVTRGETDRSYQYQQGRLDKMKKPVDDAVAKFSKLQDVVNQKTPQADALVAPALLSVTAGGAGSGLRMNEAEISRIVGGRSKWEDLKAALNKWDPNSKDALSITDEQRREIRSLVGVISARLLHKQSILESANDDLLSARSVAEQREIVAEAQKKTDKVDRGYKFDYSTPDGKFIFSDDGKNWIDQEGNPIKSK